MSRGRVYFPGSSSSSQPQSLSTQLLLLVTWTFGNMFTRFCNQVVSKVRQTVVDVWQQHPQLQGAPGLFTLVFNVGARKDDRVGRVKVVGAGAVALATFGTAVFALRVLLADDM